MRIGASFNFPQLPQRPPSQAIAPTSPNADQKANSSRSSTPANATDFSADLIKARANQGTDSDRYSSTNRELSLRGQEAMQTYLTNAGFQFGQNQSELVGVDLYA